MNIEIITQQRAKEMVGGRLPAGLRWYWVSGMQFYPRFGDFKHTWAGEDGLNAVIGKRQTTPEPEHLSELEGVMV